MFDASKLRHQVVHVVSNEARAAVRDARAKLEQQPSGIIFFCTHRYDLTALAEELRTFACPVVGCTSAGQISGDGFVEGGLTLLALYGDNVVLTPYSIAPLTQRAAVDVAERVNSRRATSASRAALIGVCSAP